MRINKAGVTTLLGLLMGLVMSAIVVLAVLNGFQTLQNGGNTKGAAKVNNHVHKINSLIEAGTPNEVSHQIFIDPAELIMYFSAGTKPIKLLYTGSNTQENRHLIFARPQAEACENTACVCYCGQGPFWRDTQQKPYLQARRLFTTQDAQSQGWLCTHMSCESVADDYLVFTNSRGVDAQYSQDAQDLSTQQDFVAIPLQIPLLLQGEYAGEDIYFDNQKRRHVQYLTEDYRWEGGVVLGGYAYATKRKQRKEHKFDHEPVTVRMELSSKDHVMGVCLQEKCLYQNALAQAQPNVQAIQEEEQAKDAFANLLLYIDNEHPYCMNGPSMDACATKLQYELARAASSDLTQNPYTVALTKDNNDKILFSLVKITSKGTETLQRATTALAYPYQQQASATPTPLADEAYLIKDNQGNLALSTSPSSYATLAWTTNTQGTEDVLVFITS